VLAHAWRLFRDEWRGLLLLNLAFQAAAFVVLAPLGNWLLVRLVSTSGRLALSNEDVLRFFLSPFGAVIVFMVAVATVASQLIEQAGFSWIAGGDLHGEPTSAGAALSQLARAAPRLIRLASRQVAIGLLGLAPLLAIGGAAFALITRRNDIYYLVTERPPIFWWGALLAAALGLTAAGWLLCLRIRWAFAMPVCLLARASARDALRESARLVKKSRGSSIRIALFAIGWWGVSAAALAVSLETLKLAGGPLLHGLQGQLGFLLAGVAILVLLNLLVVAGFGFFGPLGDALLTLELYREARGADHGMLGSRERTVLRSRWFLPGVTTGLVVAGLASAFVVAEFMDIRRDLKITAHRGSSARAPENTLSAIRAAIGDGADFAEIDVQEIADGALVLFHDTDLKRVAGIDTKIWEIDLARFRQLDVGAWFSEEFKGERVATLEDAIRLARGRIRLNIELKLHGHEKRLVEQAVAVLERERFQSECVISSLSQETLESVRRLAPDLKIGLIVFEAVGDLTALDVDFLSIRAARANARLLRRARRRGLEVHVWTANLPAAMASFIDLGVDNIITDHPARLRTILREREALSDQEKILLALRNWWWR